MKKNILVSTAILFAITSTSCSIFNKNKVQPEEVKEITVEKGEETTTKVGATQNAVSSIKQILGEWTIVSVYDKKVNSENMPFLNFTEEEDRVYGNNGCNVINGTYKIAKDKTIKFGNMISTMMACPDMKLETSIMKAINETTNYSFSTLSGIMHLNLLDYRGAKIMILKRHNLESLNGAWTVKDIHGEAMSSKDVKLVIDIPELKLHGNSGCNVINGAIALDPKKNNAIQFLQLISTRKMCPDMSIETALLIALEETESYKKKNSNEVMFYDNKGKLVLTLKRLDLKK